MNVHVCTQDRKQINKDVRTTLARLETLLARIIAQGDNGREA